jgi:hypothetical protein
MRRSILYDPAAVIFSAPATWLVGYDDGVMRTPRAARPVEVTVR